MKKILPQLAILLIAVVLWGCPYVSSIPLSEPTEYVNQQVIGKWYPEHDLNKENPEYYLIKAHDSLSYSIQHFQFNDNDSTYSIKEYLAWSTRISNINFLNVRNEEKDKYYLHRLDVMGDELMVLYQVTSNIDEQFKDSEKMREFFSKHMHLSFFYQSDEVRLVKKKE